MLDEEIGPLPRSALAPGRREDEGTSDRERTEDVVDGQVEAQGRQGEHAVGRADAEAVVDVEDRVLRAAVIDHHALGQTGRAGRVDDVREIGRGLLPRDGRLIALQQAGVDLDALARETFHHTGLCEREGDLGVPEEVVQSLDGQVGGDRHVGGPTGEGAEHAQDLFPAFVHDHGDHAMAANPVGKPRGAPAEFAVGERTRSDDGERVRSPCRLAPERLVEQHVVEGVLGGVDLLAEADLLGWQAFRCRAQPRGRVFGQRVQQSLVRHCHAVDHAGREQCVDGVPGEAVVDAVREPGPDRERRDGFRELAVDVAGAVEERAARVHVHDDGVVRRNGEVDLRLSGPVGDHAGERGRQHDVQRQIVARQRPADRLG